VGAVCNRDYLDHAYPTFVLGNKDEASHVISTRSILTPDTRHLKPFYEPMELNNAGKYKEQ
jgi:hypothetical protein